MAGYEQSIYYYVYIYYCRFVIIKVPDGWVEYLCFVLFEIALDILRWPATNVCDNIPYAIAHTNASIFQFNLLFLFDFFIHQ